jgi:hypothetical protein
MSMTWPMASCAIVREHACELRTGGIKFSNACLQQAWGPSLICMLCYLLGEGGYSCCLEFMSLSIKVPSCTDRPVERIRHGSGVFCAAYVMWAYIIGSTCLLLCLHLNSVDYLGETDLATPFFTDCDDLLLIWWDMSTDHTWENKPKHVFGSIENMLWYILVYCFNV